MIRVLAVAALLIHGIVCVTVTHQPANTAVEEGQNATIACATTNKLATENVQWKFKSNTSDTYNAITFNENVLASKTKFAVVGTYNLTVLGATAGDQGTYRCTAGKTDYDAYLTVAHLPDSVSVSWSVPATAGTTVNLTCSASHGRPTPFLRWTVNGVDLTSTAALQYDSVDTNGYGNSVSNLPLALTSAYNGAMAVCYVAYDGWNDAMNATFVLNVNGGPGLHMSAALMSVLLIVASFL